MVGGPVGALALGTARALLERMKSHGYINTAFGRRLLVRRVGVAGEYYFTVPTRSAPNGEWWTFNEQRGFVPVPSNARGLVAALAAKGAQP